MKKKISFYIPIIGLIIGGRQEDKYIYDNILVITGSLFAQAIYIGLAIILIFKP